MKRILLSFTIAFSVLLFWNACTPKDSENEIVTLELSDDGIFKFPSQASEKTITVTTNQAEWTSITSNRDWLKTSQSGDKLTISVTENKATQKREAEIVVLASGVGKKFYVEQEAAKVSIITTPEQFHVKSDATKLMFEVSTNTENWDAYSDDEWLTVSIKKNRNEVMVEVDKSTSRKLRTGRVFIKSGDIYKEVVIEQEGIVYFILPYMNFEVNPDKIDAFEIERNSVLLNKSDDRIDYQTNSEAFEQITYLFIDNEYYTSVAFPKDLNMLKDEKEEFISYLFENGFEETNEENVFLNKEHSAIVSISYNEKNPQVVYQFRPQQSKKYQTWNKIPFGLYDFSAKKDDVFAWEAKNGGIYDEENSDPNGDYSYYAFNANDEIGLIKRTYFIDNGGYTGNFNLLESGHVYSNMNLVFWQYKKVLYFTDEFVDLYEKSGFTYFGINEQGFHVFEHKELPIRFNLRWQYFFEFGQEVLDVRFTGTSSDSNRHQYHMNIPKLIQSENVTKQEHKQKYIIPSAIK